MNHTIDRHTAVTVAKEVEAAVAAVFAAHGLTKPKLRTTYGDSLRVTLESSPDVKDENGVNTASSEALAYARHHMAYGLPEDGLGVHFLSGGKEFVVTGLSPNRPKYPINAVSVADGRCYKFGTNVVSRIAANAAARNAAV